MLQFKIKNIVRPDKVNEEATHLLADKIKVLGCVSYPDCTYIETVQVMFQPCTKDGGIMGGEPDKRIVVKFDIETGYCPFSQVAATLRHGLRYLPIVRIEEFIKAFEYRRYYCKI